MGYSVKELRKNIEEKVLDLGISPKFRETPAYGSTLTQIIYLISKMNMRAFEENVNVIEKEKNISFNWTSPTGVESSVEISSPNSSTFSCIKTEEYTGLEKKKEISEVMATIDQAGFVLLFNNNAVVTDSEHKISKCDCMSSSEEKVYAPSGVMIQRIFKQLPEIELGNRLDLIDAETALFTSRYSFDRWDENNNLIRAMNENEYLRKTVLVRDKLDTARVSIDNKENGVKYCAIQHLSQEYGLRDMLLAEELYQRDIVITPLSQQEIDTMISNENNPKVAEGLIEYAVGRDTYSYDSSKDEYFVCDTSKSTSK